MHKRIEGDGLNLHVAVAGEGPPVILLHGFPEGAHSWRHQIAPLVAAGFSTWTPDLRGYPPSDISPSRKAYHLRHLINDVAAIAQATGHRRASIVGHDWGGIIAWSFAGAYPGLLDKLVIMNAPHMQIYLKKVWRTSQLFRSLYIALLQLPLIPEKLLAASGHRLLRNIFTHLPVRKEAFAEEDISHYVEALSRPGALKAAVDYYRINFRSDALDLASSARTNAETLVIWGDQDPALGMFLLDGLECFAPNLRIHHIPSAGHWVQSEAPDEVNDVLKRFLRRH